MKRMLVAFAFLFSLLSSCSNTDDTVDKCWVFTVKTASESTYLGETYTDNSETTINKCGLTASEAEEVAKGMEGTSTTTTSGITVTVTITVTYKEAT